MPNNPKPFRILRNPSQSGSRPKDATPTPEGDSLPDQESRIEQTVHNRVAQSLNKEREEQAQEPREPVETIQTEAAEPAHPALSPREEIAKIKRENLTGRQLRIARRMAQKNGLNPTSDLDAVRLLRKKGIDPFNRGEIMDVGGTNQGNAPAVSLPATVRKGKGAVGNPRNAPAAPPIIDDDTREREVKKIQRGLVKRRRKRLTVMLMKLACYVALPSMLAGYYYYRVATPMYSTYTEFVIQQSEAPSAAGGGLFGTTPFATVTDSIVVQGYLTSRDAMLRLDRDLGFRALFQGENIDILQRLDDDASNEDAYGVYQKKVVIGYDPTEGVIKMEVITPSPETSLNISRALVSFAEERVESQTQRMRDDTMSGAREGYEAAERKMSEAQDQVADLQRSLQTFDPAATFSLLQGQIGELDGMILERELERAELMANIRPNPTKLRVLEQKLKVLEDKLLEKKMLITEGSDEQSSVVNINAELTKAQTNLALRQELLATSLLALETSRVEAGRQTRFLSMGVAPVQSDKASYPRSFENTLLSIIVFAGLYLILSLTISILREQVTT